MCGAHSYSCPGVDENSLTARTHVFTSAVCTLGCDFRKNNYKCQSLILQLNEIYYFYHKLPVLKIQFIYKKYLTNSNWSYQCPEKVVKKAEWF